MLKWLFKKAIFCVVLVALLYYFNEKNPQWIRNVGRWIGGELGNKVSVAVSHFLEGDGEGSGLSDVVEVFREGT